MRAHGYTKPSVAEVEETKAEENRVGDQMEDREEIVDELFAGAVDLTPEEREPFFAERHASDSSLLSEDVLDEARALLSAHDRAHSRGFLQQPFAVSGSGGHYQTLGIGDHLDHYEILSFIAEGGMGEVYLARDLELDRRVAIKLIKSHLKTKEVLRRFYNERQILANLQHPNIAALLEAGVTADGLPFFVMEYVEGQSIDRSADEHKLTIKERLKLFRTVCSAVSYAHQNLIIHRDIKPGNILITPEGEPKLLDFGIAKLLDPTRSPQSQPATATAVQVMTPEYASPEQLKGELVTTATDVYSLGVLLYELLTGHHPTKFTSRRMDQAVKAICEEQPERPSAAVNHTDESSKRIGVRGPMPTPESVSEMRDTDPRRLRHILQGDLDSIVLMALRKEPERRYHSVEQFSEDIRRHLEGLSVIARKDTLSYRTAKFIQRNKIGVAAAAIILVTLLAGIAATSWAAHAARVERAKNERVFVDVRHLANSLVFELHDAIKDLPGSTPARELLIRRSLEYLDSVAQEAGEDPSLQSEIANAYIKIGDVQGAPYQANLGDTNAARES
jgi:serine/threonine protein kinase